MTHFWDKPNHVKVVGSNKTKETKQDSQLSLPMSEGDKS